MTSSVEAELKFDLVRDEFDRLLAVSEAPGLALAAAEIDDLLSTYWDSADGRLRAAGVSLRIRRTGGAHEQTVKLAGEAGSHLHARSETTISVDRPIADVALVPDAEVRSRVATLLDGAPLEPVFSIAVRRTTRQIETTAGDRVEFVLDDGEVVAGQDRRPLIEAEFELKGGDPRALFTVARDIFKVASVPVRFSRGTKADRGFQLKEGVAEAAWTPEKARDPLLDPSMSVEEGLQAVLRSCHAQIAANVAAVLAADDSEGPHQLRVGLRRLRTALLVFRPVIDPTTAERLAEEVRWLGREVGALRDLDVLAEEIVGPLASRVDATALLAALGVRRTSVRAGVMETLRDARVTGFLIDLAAYGETRGWLSPTDVGQSDALSAPLGDYAAAAVSKRWKQVARLGAKAEELDGEARHDLRKRFKKLRYALDFFHALLGRKDEKRMLRDVRKAQELLGYLNDVRMAEGLPAVVAALPKAPSRKDGEAIARAIGFCLGWHGALAEKAWAEGVALVKLET